MVRNACAQLIRGLYAALVFIILASVLFLDKSIESPFPHRAALSSGGYYLVAVLLLFLATSPRLGLRNRLASFPEKRIVIALCAIGLVTLALQALVCFDINLPVGGKRSDFAHVRIAAEALVEGKGFAGEPYFAKSPNNANIAILLSWVYRVIPSWRAIILAGAALANASVLCMSISVLHLTDDNYAALFACVLGEALAALTWRAFLPYTDVWVMPFVALFVCAAFSKLPLWIKLPCLTVLGLVSAWIKVTAFMVVLCLVAAAALCRKSPSPMSELRYNKTRVSLIVCLLLAVTSPAISSKLHNHYGLAPSQDAKGMAYMFMAGQDASGLGTVAGTTYKEKWRAIKQENDTHADRMDACFDTAMGWIADRGPIDNFVFYACKLCVSYSDGDFNSVKRPTITEDSTFLTDFYASDGSMLQLHATVSQIAWSCVILLACLLVLLPSSRDAHGMFFMTFVLSMSLYLLLFEGRAKYLYMFVPVFVWYSGIAFGQLVASRAIVMPRSS